MTVQELIEDWALKSVAVIALVALVIHFTGVWGRWFCNHNWKVIERTYSKPPMTGVSLQLPVSYWLSDAPKLLQEQRRAFERDTRDVTCMLLQCEACKKVTQVEMWGKAS